MRLLSAAGRLDMHRIRTGQLHREDWSSLTRAASALTDSKIYIDDTPGITALEMRAKIRRQRAETGIADLASLSPGSIGGVFEVLPSVVTIESIGYLRTGGVTRRLAGVVRRQDDTGFRVLHWQDHQEETGPLLP